MKSYQLDFIKLALDYGVLKFGEFTLKSGRQSPYFFNAGLFSDGNAFYHLGMYYANLIEETFKNKYDILFGPAYKGISLATASSIGLKINYAHNVPVSFNRKEVKDHGEGGKIIGNSLYKKRILLVDDVITAGTTIRDSVELIRENEGELIGIVIALDRQEKGKGELSAIQEVKKEFNVEVYSIISLNDLIEYLKTNHSDSTLPYLEKITSYREQYGVAAA